MLRRLAPIRGAVVTLSHGSKLTSSTKESPCSQESSQESTPCSLYYSHSCFRNSRLRLRSCAPEPDSLFNWSGVFHSGGKNWSRYRFDVLNKDVYPDDMFAASPALPPCGSQHKAARTWVDFYDQSWKAIEGLLRVRQVCGSRYDLVRNGRSDVIPPSWIYIEMNDRKTNTKYKSNLADTTL